MRVDYLKIKKILHIVIFSIDLLIFILVLFSSSSKSKNFKEYTGVTKFFLDLYIIVIYIALIVNEIYPKLLKFILQKQFAFMLSDKGKVILSFVLSIIFWFSKNKPQLVLGILLFLTSLILLIYELISMIGKFEEFLGKKGIEIYNKESNENENEGNEKKSGSVETPAHHVPNDLNNTPEIQNNSYNERNVEIN